MTKEADPVLQYLRGFLDRAGHAYERHIEDERKRLFWENKTAVLTSFFHRTIHIPRIARMAGLENLTTCAVRTEGKPGENFKIFADWTYKTRKTNHPIVIEVGVTTRRLQKSEDDYRNVHLWVQQELGPANDEPFVFREDFVVDSGGTMNISINDHPQDFTPDTCLFWLYELSSVVSALEGSISASQGELEIR